MFSGIIQYTSKITWLSDNRLQISLQGEFNLGDSIAINGVCLTIDKINNKNNVIFILSQKTIEITNFKYKKIACNVEHSLKIGDHLSGHIVSGHVDTVGIVKDFQGETLSISFDEKYFSKLKSRGSITIDGISLTIADLFFDYFTISIIPFY